MKKLFGLLVVMLVVVVLGGMACGGDDDDDEAGGEATVTEDPGDDGGEEETEDAGDGDGDADVEEYFDEVVAIAGRTNSALDEVNTEMSGATFDSEEEEVAANQVALENIGRTLEEAAVDMADLEAPGEVAAEHGQFVTDLGNYASVAAMFYGDLLQVTTVDEIDALYDTYGPDITVAVDATGASCLNLETAGLEFVDGLDLACPGDAQ